MKNLFSVIFLVLSANLFSLAQQQDTLFTLSSINSYPFPNELVAAPKGSRIAWAFQENGRRNVYVAEGPSWNARPVTSFSEDDGQEISSLSFSPDGERLIFVRGGDHGSNWDDHLPVNVNSYPVSPKVQILSVSFAGGDLKVLGDGEDPVISSKGIVAFHKSGQIWTVPADGSSPATQLFSARGTNSNPVWSPDGQKLAFQSNRQDHSFIGVYSSPKENIRWMDPQFKRDGSPRWSPDGKYLAFIRTQGSGGKPDSVLARKHTPWAIIQAEASSGISKTLWLAPKTMRGSIPTTHGGTNLHWAKETIVFLAYTDGWPHIYALTPTTGEVRLVTPGKFMAEHISMNQEGTRLFFSGNTGPDEKDIDRRHVVMVSTKDPGITVLTPGNGLEWTPVPLGDGKNFAYLSATSQRPPLPAIKSITGGETKLIGTNLLSGGFPDKLVTPRPVYFTTPDGFKIHAQWFERSDKKGKKPAIVYVHGGPPRQMLLGWHYSDYYSNVYAMNQYLASRGFIVLSVNYRLGIGYGYEFHNPPAAGTAGASEYIDIRSAGEWLRQQPEVDGARIGIYGGSYGGYLTAMALGRDSELFAVGVDIHGVHDRTIERTRQLIAPDKFERAPDAQKALEVAWQSSPVAYVDDWKSPVLIIHGDDDRNVRFSQSTDLVRRLEDRGVPIETLVIVDDTHHFMSHQHLLKVNRATAEFLEKKLRP